jgi:hypothetical protein
MGDEPSGIVIVVVSHDELLHQSHREPLRLSVSHRLHVTYSFGIPLWGISRKGRPGQVITGGAQEHSGAARQVLELPAFHCAHGMFQSPSPSVPGNVEPTVLATNTRSPRLVLS